jgi:hypothetical protein
MKKIAKIEKTDIIKKWENFNVSVEELRTGIYAPIDKISHNSLINKNFIENKRTRTIKTSWGEVSIFGNILTQTHKDLVDCILAVASKTKELPGGDIAVYFNRSDALKKLGHATINNHIWINDKLKEIQTTAIELKESVENKKGNFYRFNILKVAAFSEKEDSFGIVFTTEYRKYIEDQTTVNYLRDLDALLKVKSALLKAVIRFFFSHNFSSITEKQLLLTLGFPHDSARTLQLAKKEFKNNISLLKEFGICFSCKEKIFTYNKKDSIHFTFPNKKVLLAKEQ